MHPSLNRRSRRIRAARPQILGAFLLASLTLYALWPWLARDQIRTLTVYGFSTLGEVMNQAIFPAFQAEWLASTGERIEFIASFAGSGTITNQILLGVPAEIALFSLELDAERLVAGGMLSGPTWRQFPHQGVVNRTPFIILVRPGNPLEIRDFADLARPGVGVVHPDPLTSGAARWTLLAEYGSALRQTNSPKLAEQQLLGIWQNVIAQAGSTRGARTQFENGFGDALVTYEQEALFDRARGRLDADLVYPPSTVLSEHILVVIERNVTSSQRDLVDAFTAFLWGEGAQRLFIEYGFRSVDEALNQANPELGAIEDPFTVEDLGGWPMAERQIVEQIWQGRILPRVGP